MKACQSYVEQSRREKKRGGCDCRKGKRERERKREREEKRETEI